MNTYNYKFVKDSYTTLLYNSSFTDEEDINYADKHKFNVLFTETNCSNVFKIIALFLDKGYTLRVIKRKQFVDGLELEPKLEAWFIHPENKEENNIYRENIYTTTRKPSFVSLSGEVFY